VSKPYYFCSGEWSKVAISVLNVHNLQKNCAHNPQKCCTQFSKFLSIFYYL